MLKVVLLSHSPEAEKLVAAAAKICYSPSGIADIMDDLTAEKIAGFLSMLSDIGHESPIEHAAFTFGIEGVSRSLLAQMTRHRLASFSVQSQRYVAETAFEWVIPPEIDSVPEARARYIKAMENDQKDYSQLSEILYRKHLDAYLLSGMDEKRAKSDAAKKAGEDARYVLPNACVTKMMVTMNTRSLMNFFRLRCCNRAQWEIRDLAAKMLFECLRAAPALFGKAGPACLEGPCPEGKMCCGEADTVRRKYRQMKDGLE